MKFEELTPDRFAAIPETSATESLIAAAERQRRLLRRTCWTGFVFAVAALLVVLGYPQFARWQLRRHGWELDTPFSGRTGGGSILNGSTIGLVGLMPLI